MKTFVLIFHSPLVLQILENSKSEFVFESIEYLILFFCLALALIMMMLIPVVMFFSMFGNFIAMQDYKKQIDRGICFQENNNESKNLEPLCSKYLKSYSNFFKYFSALTAWNIFSLLYIIFGFESFETGLKEYFYFPFHVFQKLNNEEIYNTLYVFKSEGIFMIAIIVLTFLFFQIGKHIGLFIAKNKIIGGNKLVNLGIHN